MRRFSLLLAILLIVPLTADAAAPLLLTKFRLHDLDRNIVSSLGYDSATAVVFFKEIGSLSPQQTEAIKTYEPIGCFPFYVLRNGIVEESGYHCRTFFCVGYSRGPKQCRSMTGEPMGGVVEMNDRLSLVTLQDTRKRFDEYPLADRTPAMRRRIEELGALHCAPLYLLRFDVVVGEGYQCDEIGKYPFYSGKFSCVDDWRDDTDDEACSITVREDELAMRRQILEASGDYHPPVLGPETATGSTTGEFPDVIKGYYGYTAITELGKRGIIQGYRDGTYKPLQGLNRAELSKLLLATLRPEELSGETGCFPDVADEWYSSPVCAAKRLGWLRGYTDGTFRPVQTMTKAEGIKVIVSALTTDVLSAATLPIGVPEGEWFTPYVRKAVDLRILLEPAFVPAGEVTRADAAVWLYRALKMVGKLSSSSSSAAAQ